jgi:hypothetical protein
MLNGLIPGPGVILNDLGDIITEKGGMLYHAIRNKVRGSSPVRVAYGAADIIKSANSSPGGQYFGYDQTKRKH